MVIISEEREEKTVTPLPDGGELYVLFRVGKSMIRTGGAKQGLRPSVQSSMSTFRLLMYEKDGKQKILFSRPADVEWTFRLLNEHQVCVTEKIDHIIKLP